MLRRATLDDAGNVGLSLVDVVGVGVVHRVRPLVRLGWLGLGVYRGIYASCATAATRKAARAVSSW